MKSALSIMKGFSGLGLIVLTACSTSNEITSNYYDDGLYYDPDYGDLPTLVTDQPKSDNSSESSSGSDEYYTPGTSSSSDATYISNSNVYMNSGMGMSNWGWSVGMGFGYPFYGSSFYLGYGYPGYGWGYPGYGWGYPGYAYYPGWGYPGWGYPGYGWGYPGYGWGYPDYGYNRPNYRHVDGVAPHRSRSTAYGRSGKTSSTNQNPRGVAQSNRTISRESGKTANRSILRKSDATISPRSSDSNRSNRSGRTAGNTRTPVQKYDKPVAQSNRTLERSNNRTVNQSPRTTNNSNRGNIRQASPAQSSPRTMDSTPRTYTPQRNSTPSRSYQTPTRSSSPGRSYSPPSGGSRSGGSMSRPSRGR